MNIKEYIKERFSFLFINIIAFVVLSSIFAILKMSFVKIAIMFIIWFLPLSIYITMEYIKFKKYYSNIEDILQSLDKKYLLPEIMEKPEFLEGKLFYEVLKECNKEMHEHVNVYRDLQYGYREYIETWVHEIKTPIASSMLIIENNRNSVTDNIHKEISKIDGFVEQALYYSRSDEVSKDYIIKKFKLKTAVNNIARRNSKDFIYKRISLELGEMNQEVYSDIKWVEFILNQIVSNSIKYVNNEEGKIKIYSIDNENNVTLVIEDNGIGISENDIKRVFEKGFTGSAGRVYHKSTGIGLYLCRKLCLKLGLEINITSQLGIGTKVKVIFPLSKFSLGI